MNSIVLEKKIINKTARICVIGLGYIGLPTASILATKGYNVVGVDTNKKLIEKINTCEIYIKEPGLKTLVEASIKSNNFLAKTDLENADIFIICVPTPINEETKKPNLSYIHSAGKAVASKLEKNNLVILESTVPPLTTKRKLKNLLEKHSGLKAGKDFHLAYCPERVLPGKILKELTGNNRIIGGIDENSANAAKLLYERFVDGEIFTTTSTTAEMVKLMENTFRDVNIALANEFMKISNGFNVDIWEARELANKHPRVNILQPGPGVGGHCIPIDPWFLHVTDKENARIIRTAREINDGMPIYVVKYLETVLSGIKKPKITIFGVAYKGNVSDVRGTPAKDIVEFLLARGHKVSVYDPLVKEWDYDLSTLDGAVEDSDCLLILTNHLIFNRLDVKSIHNLMRNPLVVDTKNFLSPKWKDCGFEVIRLGN
jgi:UDP-N-acetyl-D-mannosaminuronic acid dehydrogenase